MDTRTAARILDLADAPAARGGSRSRALVIFLLIALLAAHAARSAGFPDSAQAAAMSPAGAGSRARESDHMKRLMAIGAAAALSVGASAQDAVQWRVEDGGNGHWYQFVAKPTQWSLARSQAALLGGHLATIATAAENVFAYSVCVVAGQGTWLGAAAASDRCTDPTSYQWVTGELMTVTNWHPGEPNGWPDSNTCALTFAPWASPAWWNDVPREWSCSYLVEFDADCNSDGIVDYGQIRAGELTDANANNIPDCCENGTACGCAGDTNNDRSVDGIDLATILTRWGQPAAKFPQADCNNDGAIDGTDLAIVLAGWGGCP